MRLDESSEKPSIVLTILMLIMSIIDPEEAACVERSQLAMTLPLNPLP
ncbi:MAG: hypothetical protein JXR46_06180 [Calditrichaceae bacterium]|nr:hypothetical protein [Calditrichaceae bacterium]